MANGYHPRLESDPVWFDGSNLNSFTTSSSVGVRTVALYGWDDRPDVRDVRELRAGQDGEYADNLYLGGRTVTVEGEVYGSSWVDLQARKRALAAVVQPSSSEALLKVPDPNASPGMGSAFVDSVGGLGPDAWWRLDDVASPPSSNGYDAAVLARGDTVLLQDATGANLVSGGAHAGTVNGNPVVVDGPLIGAESSGAIDFDGTGDYVNIPYAAALNPAAFTLMAWIWRDADTGANEQIFDGRTSDGTTAGFTLRINSSDKLDLRLADAGASSTVSALSVPTGRWVHVAATFGAGAVRLYIDGVLDGSGSDTVATNSTNPLRVGADQSGTAGFNGKIARPALCNAALTATEIAGLFVKGRPIADEQGSFPGAQVGTLTSAAGLITSDTNAAISGWSTSAYGVIPYNATLNPATFSIVGRIKRDTDSGSSEYIIDSVGPTFTGYYVAVTNADKLSLRIGNGASSVIATGATSLATGTEYTFAATYDGTNARVYLDGVLDGTSGSVTISANASGAFYIGRASSGTNPFTGPIDELQVYSGTVLTAAEIALLHDTAEYDPDTYRTDDMYGYERINARVIEAIQFGETLDPLCQSFQVVMRASDPRVYSDVETTSESGTTGTSARTVTVDQAGTYETPATLTVTGPTGSDWAVQGPTGGAVLSMSGLTLIAADTVAFDTRDRTATLGASYERIRTTDADIAAAWMLDETSGTTADNAQGTATYDGTYTGGFTLNQTGHATGVPSVTFNGSSGYVAVSYNAALNPSTATVEMWARWTSGAGGLYSSENGGTGDGYSLGVSSSGQLTGTMGGGGGSTNFSAPYYLVASEWAHIVFTYSVADKENRIYVNGVLVDTNIRGGTVAVNSSADTWIGRSSGAGYFNGRIGPVSLFDTVKTAAEIADLYAASAATTNLPAYSYLNAEASRWANIGSGSEAYTLSSSGLDAGSKLGVAYRDARI